VKRLSAYRIVVREGFERVPGEPFSGQIAERSLPASPLPEDPRRPLSFGLQALEDIFCDLGVDPVATEISADERVARVALGELLGPLLREPIIGEKSGGGEAVERSGPLVLRDSGALEPLLEIPP
jgi:hypothetical protein